MVNYSNGKVYKIVPTVKHEEGDVYFGSTTKQYLSQRMDKHRSDFKCKNTKFFCASKILFDKYGVENCIIVLLELVDAKSNDELKAVEAKYIINNICVNKYIPLRTGKQYNADNADRISIRQKQYNEANADQIKIKTKEYNEANADQIRDKKKQHYEANADQMREKAKQHYETNADQMREKAKQYRLENKEQLNEKKKQYRLQNREKYNERQQQYRLENKEQLKEKAKQHYEANADQIKEKAKQCRLKKKAEL
jgi:hypothetical protein